MSDIVSSSLLDFSGMQDKLMARISNSNIAPTSGVVAVAAPAPPSHALPPAKASSARPSVPGHVAVPNAKATDVQPSTDQLKIMHVPLDVKPGQRPSNLAGGIKILSAEPRPATCNPDDIRLLQTTQRKRKEQEDCINDNAGIPSLQPPTSQNKKVQRPAAVVEDVVFNAPKTIEEIRAEKKVKNSKAINTNEEPPGQSVPTVEDEDIDFDVDGVDDDFEAQMRALEDAL